MGGYHAFTRSDNNFVPFKRLLNTVTYPNIMQAIFLIYLQYLQKLDYQQFSLIHELVLRRVGPTIYFMVVPLDRGRRNVQAFFFSLISSSTIEFTKTFTERKTALYLNYLLSKQYVIFKGGWIGQLTNVWQLTPLN